MRRPFTSVEGKIQRAKQHTDQLEREIKAWSDSHPYEVGTKGDPKSGPRSLFLKGDPKPIPPHILLTLGDTVHCLRSALDHFAYAVVVGPGPENAFPVLRRQPTVTKWHSAVNGKLKGATPTLIQAVEALHVYEGGNGEWLWAIDYLDIVDKHRLLITTVAVSSGVTVHMGTWTIDLNAADWTPLERDTVFYSFEDPDGFHHKTEPQPTLNITFAEPKILAGDPVMPTLRGLIDEVEGLLQRLILLA